MTRKIYKRLTERKAVLKRLLNGSPLQEQYTLLERLRIINRKLDMVRNYNFCGKGGES